MFCCWASQWLYNLYLSIKFLDVSTWQNSNRNTFKHRLVKNAHKTSARETQTQHKHKHKHKHKHNTTDWSVCCCSNVKPTVSHSVTYSLWTQLHHTSQYIRLVHVDSVIICIINKQYYLQSSLLTSLESITSIINDYHLVSQINFNLLYHHARNTLFFELNTLWHNNGVKCLCLCIYVFDLFTCLCCYKLFDSL